MGADKGLPHHGHASHQRAPGAGSHASLEAGIIAGAANIDSGRPRLFGQNAGLARDYALPRLTSISTALAVADESSRHLTAKAQSSLPHPPFLCLQVAPQSAVSASAVAAIPSSEASHSAIQATWTLFAAMSDAQRNQMLKGLLSKCSSKQVEFICTNLNLKLSEPLLPGQPHTLFATDAVGKFSPQTRMPLNRKAPGRIASTHKPDLEEQMRVDSTMRDHLRTQNGQDAPFRQIHESTTPSPNCALQAQNSHPEASHHLTLNLYIKLLNTNFNPTTVLKQMRSTSNLESTRTLLEFVILRAHKQQNLLSCLQSLSNPPMPGSLEEQQTPTPMQQVLKCALSVCGAVHGTLYSVDETTGDIHIAASTWAKEGVLEPGSLSPGASVVERILGGPHLFKGEIINMFNVKESDLYTDDIHDFYGVQGKCEVECVLSMPVIVSGVKIIGAIEVLNKHPTGIGGINVSAISPYFNAEDEQMLKFLSSVWTIMANGNKVEGFGKSGSKASSGGSQKKDDIKMLMNTANFLSADMDLNGLVRVVMHTAQELLSAERCALFLVDFKKKELWSSVAEGAGEIRIPINKGIAGHVATTGEILNIPDAYQDPRFNRSVDIKTGFRTRNILCIPMKNAKGQVIGVTQLINKMPEPLIFTAEDEALLTAFSALAASTIEKNMIFQELKEVLDDTNAKNAKLSQIVNSLPQIIITIDGSGKLVSISHPKLLHLSPEAVESMKSSSFDLWLNRIDNQQLIGDIRKAFRGTENVSAKDYELLLNGQQFSVNYAIHEMIDVDDRRYTPEQSDIRGLSGDIDASSENSSEHTDSIGSESESETLSSVEENENSRKQKKIHALVIAIELISPKKRMREALIRYIPQDIVETIITGKNESIEGKHSSVSCITVDLQNCNIPFFHDNTNGTNAVSIISESTSASDAMFILGLHHTAVNEIANELNGLLDKTTNQKAVVAFGLPHPADSDTSNAVTAALKLHTKYIALNDKLNEMNLPAVEVGIGIATGLVFSGVVSVSKKYEYLFMGDTVEMSSYIQSATKLYGCKVMVCEKTHREVRDKIHFREIDNVVVKSTGTQLTLFEVLGPSNVELPREVIVSRIMCFALHLTFSQDINYLL
ncbi:hypothetical protein HDU82_006278 [Entophlyctis luteolus]|nr:hypothetical protein HDU82_006278 [Entophlyctis luteolus]